VNPQHGEATAVSVSGLHKWFGQAHVLRGVDLEVRAGEKVCILGPSGSGKSTLIRCINGLEPYDDGRVRLGGVDLSGPQKSAEAARRTTGMVFQSFNLFPHLSVLENCALAPIHVRKLKKADAEARAMALLERVRIAEHAGKRPAQLSGGQQQRAAIARGVGDGAGGNAVRRAHQRARPRDGGRGAGGHDRAGPRRHDHDRGHP
jgi:ABC-type polar amino acid transport system ATPase subunit